MTVIVACRDGGTVWIGSDTQANNADTVVGPVEKWIIRKPWAVGVAGNWRTLNVLQANADDLFDGLAGAYDFTCRARGLLERDGFNAEQNVGPKEWGQEMILAHPGGVWSVCNSFSIVEVPEGQVWADGSGRAYALGASFACKGSAKERVRTAVKAAIRYSSACGGEVFLRSLKG